MQTSADFAEAAFREQAGRDGITHISTGVAILRDGKILLARRAAGDYLGGVYELPGGGVDAGETIIAGALREVKEETGLTVKRIVAVFSGFDYSTDKKPKVRQVNLLVEAEPGEVVLDPDEHDDYAWVDESNRDTVSLTDSMRLCLDEALRLIKSQ